ncbi:MAG: phasin family protein [Hyphomicrobiales bacterium]
MTKKSTNTETGTSFEMPASVRKAAEKSLDQSRQTYDNFKGATEEVAGLVENQAQVVADSTTALNLKALDIAQNNLNSTFDLARNLLGSKDLGEAVEMQLDFARKQIEALNGQAMEFGNLTTKAAKDAAKPYGAQMEKAMSQFQDVLPS